jgi:Family of unknown function (DUF5990)
MTPTSQETWNLHLRLIAEAAPPDEHDSRRTEFGLQDKKQQLHPGQVQSDGTVQFDLDVRATFHLQTGTVRFTGPFVHGTPAEPFLYLSWGYEGGPPKWIRRQKVPLAAITFRRIVQAQRESKNGFRTTVPPITASSASVPVEWVALDE